MKLLLGNISERMALAFSEAAIHAAWEASPRSSKARFALTRGLDQRLYVRRYNKDNPVNPAEWIATFNSGSDPDWLAGEIEDARL